MTANATANCLVTGLFANTTYDFYFVAEDTSTNLQLDAAASGPVIATTLDPLISSLVFTDTNLDACIKAEATARGWLTVSQLIDLPNAGPLPSGCVRRGITNLAGAEQLTGLTRSDFSSNPDNRRDAAFWPDGADMAAFK